MSGWGQVIVQNSPHAGERLHVWRPGTGTDREPTKVRRQTEKNKITGHYWNRNSNENQAEETFSCRIDYK